MRMTKPLKAKLCGSSTSAKSACPSLRAKDGDELLDQSLCTLEAFGSEKRTLALPFGEASLDIFWLGGESLSDLGDRPAPEIIAQEIGDDLEVALGQLRLNAGDVNGINLSEV